MTADLLPCRALELEKYLERIKARYEGLPPYAKHLVCETFLDGLQWYPDIPTRPQPDTVAISRGIAKAALCLLRPNPAITDTIWLDGKTNITLYEHLVSYLDVELTGDVDRDIEILEAAFGEKK